MSAAQNRRESAGEREEPPEGQASPIPDEDGPHDVPDEKVIEKTLPTAPGAGKDPPQGR
ncbi:MAG TPA: hypothetical protein VN649_04585 [Ramlibacter sp.]|nr:hypothetical protein [Ramlibacter sp.]